MVAKSKFYMYQKANVYGIYSSNHNLKRVIIIPAKLMTDRFCQPDRNCVKIDPQHFVIIKICSCLFLPTNLPVVKIMPCYW